MITPDYSGLGYFSQMTVKGGHLIEGVNQAYKTPYKMAYNGMAVSLAKSVTYDATATPTAPVVVPCKTGERPYGWLYVSTQEHNPLPGTPTAYLPKDAHLDQTDSDGIAYAGDFGNWAKVTVAPYSPCEGIGCPLAAGQKIAVGDEIAVATGGFYRKASAGQVVVGNSLTEADNTAGQNAGKFIWVNASHQYTKA